MSRMMMADFREPCRKEKEGVLFTASMCSWSRPRFATAFMYVTWGPRLTAD